VFTQSASFRVRPERSTLFEEVMCFRLPAEMLASNATKFGDFAEGQNREVHKTLMTLFFHIGNTLTHMRNVAIDTQLRQFMRKRPRATEEEDAPEPPMNEELVQRLSREKNTPAVRAFCVPVLRHADEDESDDDDAAEQPVSKTDRFEWALRKKQVMGYAFLIFNVVDGARERQLTLGHALMEIMRPSKKESFPGGRVRKPHPPSRACDVEPGKEYTNVRDRNDLAPLFDIYTMSGACRARRHAVLFGNLSDPSNPANPTSVFNPYTCFRAWNAPVFPYNDLTEWLRFDAETGILCHFQAPSQIAPILELFALSPERIHNTTTPLYVLFELPSRTRPRLDLKLHGPQAETEPSDENDMIDGASYIGVETVAVNGMARRLGWTLPGDNGPAPPPTDVMAVHTKVSESFLTQKTPNSLEGTSFFRVRSKFASRLEKARRLPWATFRQKQTRAFELQRIRTAMLKDYDATCTNETADLSIYGKKINAYWNANPELAAYCPTCRLADPNKSIFANIMIRTMEQLQYLGATSTCHIQALTVVYGVLDAYRVDDSKLHYNALLEGPLATSKSFVLDLVEMFMMPGTTESLTRETFAAGDSPENRSDHITLHHEIQPNKVMSNEKGDDSKATKFKEQLTTQRQRTMELIIDPETKERVTNIIESACVGCVLAATNLSTAVMDPAIVSRFFHFFFADAFRTECTQADMQDLIKNMSVDRKNEFEKVRTEHHWLQYVVYHTFKCMYIGAIDKIDTTNFAIIRQTLIVELRKRGYPVPHTRVFELIVILANVLAITRAVYQTYAFPQGPHYQEPFQTQHLIDINHLLIMDEEIVLFAFALYAHAFIQPYEDDIRRALAQMVTPKDEPNFQIPWRSRRNFFTIGNQPNSFDQNDYAYIRMQGTTTNIAHNIWTSWQSIQDAGPRPAETHILEILRQFETRSFLAHPYTLRHGDPIPTPDKTKPMQHANLIETDRDNTYMHTSILDPHHRLADDTLWEMLRPAVEHKHTRPRTIIWGQPLHPIQFPNLLKTIPIQPRLDRTKFINNPAAIAEPHLHILGIDPAQFHDPGVGQTPILQMDMDGDTAAIHIRTQTIAIPPPVETTQQKMDPVAAAAEIAQIQNADPQAPPPIDYPADFQREQQQAIQMHLAYIHGKTTTTLPEAMRLSSTFQPPQDYLQLLLQQEETLTLPNDDFSSVYSSDSQFTNDNRSRKKQRPPRHQTFPDTEEEEEEDDEDRL